MANIKSKEELVRKIMEKSASQMPKDPNEQGTVSNSGPVFGDEHNNTDSQLPPNGSNEGNQGDPQANKQPTNNSASQMPKDPNEQGTVSNSGPVFGDEHKNTDSQLPPNGSNEGNQGDPQANKQPTLSDKAANIVSKIKHAKTQKQAETQTHYNDVNQPQLNSEFTPEFHMKLASVLLQTEEGRKYTENLIKESVGADVASNLVKAAAYQEDQYNVGQNIQEFEQIQNLVAQELDGVYKKASTDEKTHMQKLAQAHSYNLSQYDYDFEKQAYDEGAENAYMMMDAADAGMQPEDVQTAAEEVTIEDIQMLLEQLIQENAISPEEADQILQAFAAEQEGQMQGGTPMQEGQTQGGAPMPEVAKAASIASQL